jgi:hypothetical protein
VYCPFEFHTRPAFHCLTGEASYEFPLQANADFRVGYRLTPVVTIDMIRLYDAAGNLNPALERTGDFIAPAQLPVKFYRKPYISAQ